MSLSSSILNNNKKSNNNDRRAFAPNLSRVSRKPSAVPGETPIPQRIHAASRQTSGDNIDIGAESVGADVSSSIGVGAGFDVGADVNSENVPNGEEEGIEKVQHSQQQQQLDDKMGCADFDQLSSSLFHQSNNTMAHYDEHSHSQLANVAHRSVDYSLASSDLPAEELELDLVQSSTVDDDAAATLDKSQQQGPISAAKMTIKDYIRDIKSGTPTRQAQQRMEEKRRKRADDKHSPSKKQKSSHNGTIATSSVNEEGSEKNRDLFGEMCGETIVGTIGDSPSSPKYNQSERYSSNEQQTIEHDKELSENLLDFQLESKHATSPSSPSHHNRNVGVQLQIINGRAVLNQETLVRQEEEVDYETQFERVTETNGSRYFTQATYSNQERTEKWTREDTAHFYNGLRQFGADFSMISRLFPTRSRKQIKNKFKKEEREQKENIEWALKNRIPINVEEFRKQNAKKREIEGSDKKKKDQQRVIQDKEREQVNEELEQSERDRLARLNQLHGTGTVIGDTEPNTTSIANEQQEQQVIDEDWVKEPEYVDETVSKSNELYEEDQQYTFNNLD